MLRKIWAIFIRDLKINTREFITIWIMSVPVLFALVINALAPSINDSTVRLALVEGENPAQVEYLENFARVSLFNDEEAVSDRVARRDDFIGIIRDGDDYYILAQGNENQAVVDFAKTLQALYVLGADIEDSTAEIIELGRDIPPLKKMLVNISILFGSILGGMLIAINIVEEKGDNTISAINVTPVSRIGFVLGKSMMGLLLPIYGSLAVLFITGFGYVNIGQMLLVVLSATLLSLLIGFVEGLANDDMMTAVASFKMIFFPVAGAVAVAEAVSDKWQWTVWWIPYYWTYKGTGEVLSETSTWPSMLLYTGIIIALCAIVFVVMIPKVRSGLEKS
ncbi:MAG TPA: ABC transporter permease [Clostridia bacterium]|nr:ABC transporter permease [Clostridia bacterium]HPQ47290.1 ABC transporter permease [Clostridia bacterium]HRX41445.1 ABC transporter permease [Clostridia bacterium]